MKKQFSILLLLGLVCLPAASCTENKEPPNEVRESFTVNDSADHANETFPEKPDAVDSVEVDLTQLSSIMVYAEVYNIMMEPESYVGKTIKGSGAYNAFYYQEMDRYFHYFIVSDAAGCCPQGLDFVWQGEHVYPDDYPELGDNIEVTGVFTKGEVFGQTYYYIAVDDLTILKS